MVSRPEEDADLRGIGYRVSCVIGQDGYMHE